MFQVSTIKLCHLRDPGTAVTVTVLALWNVITPRDPYGSHPNDIQTIIKNLVVFLGSWDKMNVESPSQFLLLLFTITEPIFCVALSMSVASFLLIPKTNIHLYIKLHIVTLEFP